MASPKVIEMTAQLLWQRQQHKVSEIIFGGSGDKKLAGLRGMLFETHGHHQIPVGGRFHMRQLKRKGDKREVESASSQVGRMVCRRTDVPAGAGASSAVGVIVAALGVNEDDGGDLVVGTDGTQEIS